MQRTEIDHLLSGRVGNALLRKGRDSYNDENDAYQLVCFHFELSSRHQFSLLPSASLNQIDNNNNDGKDQQDVNKTSQCVTTHQPQRPKNDQYYGYRPQHVTLLSDCLFSLPAITSS
jgi:hypothetical protein